MVNKRSMLNTEASCLTRLLVNWVPLSVKICRGKLIQLKMSIVASATAFAVIKRTGTVSGQRVAIHTAVSMYLTPPFALERGPTMSSASCSKGWLITDLSTMDAFIT